MVKEEKIVHPDSDWIGATVIEDKPTRASSIIVFILCAWLILSVIGYGAVDYWALGLQAIGAAVIGLLWLWDAAIRREFRISRSLLLVPLLGLFLIGCIQLLPLRDVSTFNQLLGTPAAAALSLDPGSTRLFLVQLFVYLIYFAAALTFISDQKRLRAVTITILVFGLGIAVFAIIQGFSSEGKIYWSRFNPGAIPFGTYVNRHHFAALMEMTIALALGLLYARAIEKELWTLQVFAAVMMCVALIFTGSRGAMLSLLAIIGFLTVFSQRAAKSRDDEKKSSLRRRLLSAAGAFMLVLALIGIVLVLGGDNDLLRAVGLGNSGDDISNGRLHFWQTSLQVFRDNPILGVGFDALGSAYTRYDTWNGVYRVERAHNDYVQILAESGILGFVCLAAFLFLLFWRGWQVMTNSRDSFRRGVALGALAGCLGIVVHSFFDFPLRTPANALVFLILATLATVQINYPKLHRKRNK
ncbi:MAG: O-antigen ligase family protein [Acidobacteriota bacterium]|nr:O-antigen ligase family protein [Acidobacteriota bacterium]